jgi:hypothetical protein
MKVGGSLFTEEKPSKPPTKAEYLQQAKSQFSRLNPFLNVDRSFAHCESARARWFIIYLGTKRSKKWSEGTLTKRRRASSNMDCTLTKIP